LEKLLAYFAENQGEILLALKQHIVLSGVAVLLGLAISLCICIISSMKQINIDRLINFFSFLRLIPGVALLVVAMPIMGTGAFPALCTLTLLTIPSILINTYAGIKNIPPATIESAISLGLENRQILFRIQLPIAVPFIILGVRTAVVDAVTVATIAALMGAGGLGRYVMTGLVINNMTLVLIGSILITIMAFGSEAILGIVQKHLEHKYTGR
jgi:osmoprotectant transport system permease protein